MKRYTMKKHTESVNFIDFKPSHALCASCADDKTVIVYNYASYRQEGVLPKHESEVKICKFLNPYHALVSADLEGKLYFWAVTPSPRRNELLAVVKDDNESEVGTVENFPIRAIDFDPSTMTLYTGDEMGFMHKWDVSALLNKLEALEKKPRPSGTPANPDLTGPGTSSEGAATFLTGVAGGEPLKSPKASGPEDDVVLVHRWKAHEEGINWVTFVEEPECIATCSFDRNVYIWSAECEKIGSLVLGHDKHWKIHVDKSQRNEEERSEAEGLLDNSNTIKYEELFSKKKRDVPNKESKLI